MARSFLLKCIVCDQEFVFHEDNVFKAHCPNCDINKNRFGFCIEIDRNLGKCEEAMVNMSNMGLTKIVPY